MHDTDTSRILTLGLRLFLKAPADIKGLLGGCQVIPYPASV